MITKRLLTLQIVALVGLGSVFLLPAPPKTQPMGVNMQLPREIGKWIGEDEAVTDKEIGTLGPGTEFARKRYHSDNGDAILVSIVLSGQDMNTSIHLPERCLPAQGWDIADKRVIEVPVTDKEGTHQLGITRLHNRKSLRNRDGAPSNFYALDYYWFIGYDVTTPNHWVRTWIDIRDRLTRGYNQRWAFVTVLSELHPSMGPDEKTDKVMQDFIRELVPVIQRDSVRM
jgi:EpsI family protein